LLTLSLCLLPSGALLSLWSFWRLWRQCLISRVIACTHARKRGSERDIYGWTFCLAESRPLSSPHVCVCVCNGRRSIAFRWQFINFISSSLHLYLARTHTHKLTHTHLHTLAHIFYLDASWFLNVFFLLSFFKLSGQANCQLLSPTSFWQMSWPTLMYYYASIATHRWITLRRLVPSSGEHVSAHVPVIVPLSLSFCCTSRCRATSVLSSC